VTALERRYADFDGLNLVWETLEGLVKHNGPLTDRAGKPAGHYRDSGLPHAIGDYTARHDLLLWSFASAEAQAAAIADDIAYDAHDIDDGLRAELFSLDDIAEVSLIGGILREIRMLHPSLEPARVAHELVRRLITWMIEDVIAESQRRIEMLDPVDVAAIRAADAPVVAFSAAMTEAEKSIKGFLYPRMYRHARVMDVMRQAQDVLRDLYAHYMAHPADLPEEWRNAGREDEASRARRTGDFIAGMTDRYALAEHARFFASTPELR
jgi:dGTPase